MTNLKFKKAFTLAEVLITLGIIGVVAALTLPSVITNYQKQQTVVQLRKVFSDLSNSVRLSEVDNGPMDSWDFPYGTNTTETIPFLEKYYLPYFKGAKFITSNDIVYETNEGGTFRRDYGILLNNGVILWFYMSVKVHQEGVHDGCIFIFADINGTKGPNKLGRDVFVFDGLDYADKISTGKWLYRIKFWQIPGKMDTDYLKVNVGYGCNKENTGTSHNYYCGRLIEVSGWKIPDDYPW
jgi:prepilin-type N-terminal cleavage/methylation domain-containing protein